MTGYSYQHAPKSPLFDAAREAADIGRTTGNKAMAYISIASVAVGAASTAAAVGMSLFKDLKRDHHTTEKTHDEMLKLLVSIDRKLSKDKGFER